MSKDKLSTLKRRLEDILKTIDDDGAEGQPLASQPSSSRPSTSTGFTSRAIANFRQAFPALSRPSFTSTASKRQKLSATATPLLVKNTYTATFCCLERNSEFSPTAKELYSLSCNCLGKKRHSLDKDGNHNYIRSELEKIFPRLKHVEGKFMLFRTVCGGSGRRQLHKIPIGPQGYSTVWLCDEMAIGTACIYVVPFGKLPKYESNVEAEKVLAEVHFKNLKFRKKYFFKVDGNMPEVKCDMCGDTVKLNLFEDHTCQDQQESLPPERTQVSIGEYLSIDDQIEEDRALAEKLQQHEEEEDVSLLNEVKGIAGSTAFPAATCPLTLDEALSNIHNANDPQTATHSTFLIQRSRVWNTVVQEMRNIDFQTYRMSAEFIGECAADTGGPTRELFSLIYKDVIGSKLTRGSVPNVTFSHDQSSLLASEYKIFGQLIALAFLNNASLPHCFSPSVAHYILGNDYNTSSENLIEELPADHATVKEKLKSLLSCVTPDKWDKALNDFKERFDMGINKGRFTIQEKEVVIKMANKHVMVSCVAEEILSFQDGLSLFGVLDALKKFPEEALNFLTDAELTTDDIRKSLYPKFSIKGSSKRPSEETVIFNFHQFLKQCARGNVQRTFIDISSTECFGMDKEKQQTLSLNDVLQFISGSRHLPPGPFNGTINFVHDSNKGQRIKANTCALQLSIPINARYCSEDSAVFISNMADDIFDSQVFGCV